MGNIQQYPQSQIPQSKAATHVQTYSQVKNYNSCKQLAQGQMEGKQIEQQDLNRQILNQEDKQKQKSKEIRILKQKINSVKNIQQQEISPGKTQLSKRRSLLKNILPTMEPRYSSNQKTQIQEVNQIKANLQEKFKLLTSSRRKKSSFPAQSPIQSNLQDLSKDVNFNIKPVLGRKNSNSSHHQYTKTDSINQLDSNISGSDKKQIKQPPAQKSQLRQRVLSKPQKMPLIGLKLKSSLNLSQQVQKKWLSNLKIPNQQPVNSVILPEIKGISQTLNISKLPDKPKRQLLDGKKKSALMFLSNETVKKYKNIPIIQLIASKPMLCCLFSKSFFQKLNQLVNNESWSQQHLVILNRYLTDYIQYSINIYRNQQGKQDQTQLRFEQISQQFSSKINRILNQTILKNAHSLQNLQYAEQFMKQEMSFKNTELLQKILSEVGGFSFNNSTSLIYLSTYLTKSSKEMQNKNIPLNKINDRLVHLAKNIIKNLYNYVEQEIQEQKQYASREQYDLDKYGVIEDYNKYQNKIANSSRKLDEPKSKNKQKKTKVSLINQQTNEGKNQQMTRYIKQLRSQSKKQQIYNKFVQLTSECCYKFKGFNFQIGQNIYNSDQLNDISLLRFKQSLLQNQLIKGQYSSQKDNQTKLSKCSSINQLIKQQIKQNSKILQKYYDGKSQTKVQQIFILSGRCKFSKIQSLNMAVSRLKQKIEQSNQSMQLISIQNRLIKKQRNLTIKFRINKNLCELKLYLKSFETLNQILQQLQNLLNSKLINPITSLFQWHHRTQQTFVNNISKILNEKKDIQNKKELNALLNKFSLFINYDLDALEDYNIKEVQSENIINKVTNQVELKQIKQKLVSNTNLGQSKNLSVLKRQKQLTQKTAVRSAKCLKLMKKYRQSLEQLQSHTDKQDVQYLILLSQLNNHIGCLSKAIEISDKVIKNIKDSAQKKANPKLSPNKNKNQQYLINAYKVNAQCLQDFGKYKEAQKVYQQLMKIQKQKNGQLSYQYAQACFGIGRALYLQFKLQSSKKYLEKGLQIYSKIWQTKDENSKYRKNMQEINSEYCKALCKIGEIYIGEDKIIEAQQILNIVIDFQNQICGEYSLQMGQTMSQIAIIYISLNKLEEAQKLLKVSSEIAEGLIGRQTKQFSQYLISLSILYQLMQQDELALGLLKVSQHISIKLWGEQSCDNAVISSCFGSLFMKKGQFDKAIQYLNKSLKIFKYLNQQQNPTHTNIYTNLAKIYKCKNDNVKMANYLELASEFVSRLYGEQSIQTAMLSESIIQQFIESNLLEQAEQIIGQTIELYKKLNIENPQKQLQLLQKLFSVQDKQGKYQQAEQSLKKVIKYYQDNHIQNLKYVNLCQQYATLMKKQKKLKQTEEMFRKTLNVFNAMTANKNKNNRQISNAVSDQKNTEDKYRSTFTFGFGVGSKVQNKTQKQRDQGKQLQKDRNKDKDKKLKKATLNKK